MDITPSGLRFALETALEREAREAVARHHGDPSALSLAEVLASLDWLRSDEIEEAKAAFAGEGLFSAEEAAAFEWHVWRLRRDQVLARARRSLESLRSRRFRAVRLGDALESLVERPGDAARAAVREAADLAAPVLLDRRGEADERAGPEPICPDVSHAESALARETLTRTEERFDEARERLGLLGRPLDLFEWVRAIRHPECDAPFERETRLRRLAGFTPAFERELSSRVRPLRSATLVGPRPRALLVRPPEEIRLVLPELELGLISESLYAVELGRALAASLASPALPASLRYHAAGTVGSALGWMIARALGDPAYARRDPRLGGRRLEEIRVRSELLLLFSVRFLALSVEAEEGGSSPEQCTELAESRLGLRLDRSEAALAMLTPRGARPRLRARVFADRLYDAFVERYDEDFLWNPRFEEPLRAATERGGLLSVEVLAHEVGA